MNLPIEVHFPNMSSLTWGANSESREYARNTINNLDKFPRLRDLNTSVIVLSQIPSNKVPRMKYLYTGKVHIESFPKDKPFLVFTYERDRLFFRNLVAIRNLVPFIILI